MSMVDPSIDELAQKAYDQGENRYTLTILAAKRAKEINEKHKGENLPEREISMAFKEIMENKIIAERIKR